MFQIRPRVPWGWRVRWREWRVGVVANQWKACGKNWLVFDPRLECDVLVVRIVVGDHVSFMRSVAIFLANVLASMSGSMTAAYHFSNEPRMCRTEPPYVSRMREWIPVSHKVIEPKQRRLPTPKERKINHLPE